jgi:hypothetical protein
VFQDVAAIGVGTDFVDQVEQAISRSDASLVVIGPDWLGATDSEGRRRLDDPDDHVRSEVRSALASPHPVVPVLVGGALLPTEADLPEDLAPLARRQAVELRDATWAEDVEVLVRRLEGKEVAKPRRITPWAIALALVVVGALAAWRAMTGSENGATPECEAIRNDLLTRVDVPPGASAVDDSDDRLIRYTVSRADYLAVDPNWFIVLQVEARNETPETGNQAGLYYSKESFVSLLVDGFVSDPTCFTPIAGNRDDVLPGQAASGIVGFESMRDPTGAELVLGINGGQLIEISPGV